MKVKEKNMAPDLCSPFRGPGGTQEDRFKLPVQGVGGYAIVDCNSFYCSAERVFRPDLQKKPVVVLSNNDGCIISRSDEAEAFGVGMPVPISRPGT